jgi:hypothetical protein
MAGAQRAHRPDGHSGRVNTWGLRKTVGAIAVAAAVAGVGGAAIAAAAGVGQQHSMFGGPGGPPPPSFHRGSAGDVPAPLHAESVVAGDHGGFSTVLTQTGHLTAVSATSVTARSDDGYVRTYVVPPANGPSTAPFGVNDRVSIEATLAGPTATLTSIRPVFTPNP